MPFDDANWNGGEGGGEPQRSWSYTLTAPAIAGLTVVRMELDADVIVFVLGDDLPAGTVIWATMRRPLPFALVTYPLPSKTPDHMTVRVEMVDLW